ncbi:unnamed protein product [Brachionus calyciflorus]|uniref:Protein-tyrosine-phosphatase n=1 Tax=Brachionus calyciflorus TaxID=104777 RepID=A0A813T9Y3_9BILA|nr:unnamed protein product [Brachionus calyciflorus]
MVIIFLFLFNLVTSQTDEIPMISDVTQINETTIKLNWIYKKFTSNENHRFRVQFSKDNFHYDINEWPCNYEYSNVTNGIIIKNFTVKSSFECYMECIKNFECKSAQIYSDKLNYCYLNTDNANITNENGTFDLETIKISDYKNETYINNFPYNNIFKFRVMIYDKVSDKWSPFSEPSTKQIDTRINLFITVERISNTSLKVKWEQVGEFKNYTISRYNVQISTNEEPFEDNYDLKNLDTMDLVSSLYEFPLPPISSICKSERDCLGKCIDSNKCVNYVYDLKNGSCFLLNSYNPLNGFKKQNLISKFIKSSSNEFILNDLIQFTNYKIKVNFKTVYGSEGFSNLASYVLTNLKPFLRIQAETNDFTVNLNWTILEPVNLRTYLIHSSINESSYFDQYFESNSHDYEDQFPAIFDLNLNDCFYKCALNSSCIAFSWSRNHNKCFLKSNKNKTVLCSMNFFCSSILDYNSEIRIKNHFVNTKYCYMISVLSNFGLAGEKSNQVCFKWNVTVNVKSDIDFLENNRVILYCDLNGISLNQVEYIKWIKNSQVFSEAKINQESAKISRLSLELYRLNHTRDNGMYSCGLILTNGQIIYSNQLDLKVRFSPLVKLDFESKIKFVDQGDSVNISCSSFGYPIPEIKFLKNGTLVEKALEFYDHEKFRKKIFLNIEKASFRDNNGTYTCFLNENLQHNFELFVKYGPKFYNNVTSYNVNETDTILMECSVEKSPKPKLKWKKLGIDGVNLEGDIKFSNDSFMTSILKFENVSRENIGDYVCYDEDYSKLEQEFNLNVHFPALILEELVTVEFKPKINSTLELNCTSIGYPLANIEWKFDSFNVLLNPSIVTNSSWNQTSILILENVQRHDHGIYSCRILSNNVYHQKKFVVNIKSKPNRPVIVEAELLLNGFIKIVWFVDDMGNSGLKNGFLEWASNFDKESTTKSIEFKFSELLNEENKHYEIKLNISIPDNNLLRLYVGNSIGRSDPSHPKRLSSFKIESPKLKTFTFKTTFVIIVFLIVVFAIIILLLGLLVKIHRDLKDKKNLNRESKCRLNDTIGNRSLQQLESVTTTNLASETSTTFTFLDNLISKMNDRKNENILTQTTRTNLVQNFTFFSRLASLKNKDTVNKVNNKLDSTINDINLIDKHINLPITLKSLTNHLEDDNLIDKNFYTKETLIKRFTNDFESLDKDLHFEFCEIKNPINKTFQDSLKIQNERKSRYKHVYPYDDNRVKLNLIAGRPDSDFINASYIEGYKQSKRFIAAQGPTKDTAEDFLRMIVEKEIKIVVMLTKIYEGDPPILKSWPYWNDKNIIRFGSSSCEVKAIENKLFYEKRRLKIKFQDSGSLIDHYYYKEWPDRSSPLESQSIIELIDTITKSLDYSPILVHCSAGIGRTGTFIALFNQMDMMRETNSINPNKAVLDMRKQRAYLVQNWEQYKFIHQTLLEWLIFSNSTINLTDKSSIRSILTNKQALQNEYQYILKLNDTFRLRNYSFMNIIKCESTHDLLNSEIEYKPSNNKEDLEDLNLLDFLHLRIPPFNMNFMLTTEPTNKNVNLYLTAIFRLKPEIIISLSPMENSYFNVLNETSIDRNLICGIVVLCQEIKANQFFKEFELELIDTKSKNKSIKIRYFTTEKFWDNEESPKSHLLSDNSPKYDFFQNIENTLLEQDNSCFDAIQSEQETAFVDSGLDHSMKYFPINKNEQFTKLFDAIFDFMNNKFDFLNPSSTSFSRLKNNVFLIQTDKKLNESIEKHGIFLGLMFLYLSIKVKNEANIVQIARLLRKIYPKLLNRMEYYNYLYEFCSMDSLITN